MTRPLSRSTSLTLGRNLRLYRSKSIHTIEVRQRVGLARIVRTPALYGRHISPDTALAGVNLVDCLLRTNNPFYEHYEGVKWKSGFSTNCGHFGRFR